MDLAKAACSLLGQISDVIKQIDNKDYVEPIVEFNGATIGQHFRHTIEFFQCLEHGYNNGTVSYDNRKHDILIESDRLLAIDIVKNVKTFLKSCDSFRPLKLEQCYSIESDQVIKIPTNMAREITYNIEHAIHHMAIIKIGIKVCCPYVNLPEGFGVAISTLKYQSR